MHDDANAVPAEVPRVVEPASQHALDTDTSEANKTVSIWQAVLGRE